MKTANSLMQKLLDSVKKNPDSHDSKIGQLTHILWPLFREVRGCVLMNSNRQEQDIDIQMIKERYGDRSGFEASVNHVHLNDYLLHENIDSFENVRLALAILKIWGLKLRAEFPNYTFHLVMSYDEDDGEISLRFYRLRDSDAPWYDKNTIDSYAEALLIIEVSALDCSMNHF